MRLSHYLIVSLTHCLNLPNQQISEGLLRTTNE